jgi:hypothetical protein
MKIISQPQKLNTTMMDTPRGSSGFRDTPLESKSGIESSTPLWAFDYGLTAT